ncbi:S-layer homology domain-containing protein [Tumebacillus sp. ITR2]|uniref:S-layer homology domain-containing protein n=1 Tax=Tumebacillus amylolyticus TaxID=2801339 RepID=A0ABS1JBM5_9BACL|nr:S-layer homology domain-containing protein [Tumebacillus amylolyticus]MBL0387668.1 S-layer homology domain-containing protein [Tumebacillus amylolyticus]
MKKAQQRLLGTTLALAMLFAPRAVYAYEGVASTTKTVMGRTVQLVYANLNDSNLEVKAVSAESRVGSTESLAALAQRHGALAALNGGYFNAYDDQQPLTVVRTDGKFEHNGSFGAVFGIDELNHTYFGRVYPTIQGSTNDSWVWPNNWSAWGINHYYSDPNAITILTPEVVKRSLSGGKTVVVKNNVVTAIVDGDAGVPEDGYLIHFGSGVVSSAKPFQVGERAAYKISYQDASGNPVHWEHVFNMMGGGPMLVFNGAVVVDPIAEKFTDPKQTGNVRSTRTFVGVNADNRLVLGTVPNVSVYELADVVKALGLVHAVGMDSGATAGLYANGSYLTQPGREVPNALVVSLRQGPVYTTSGFVDVANSYWANNSITNLHAKGVINGEVIDGKQVFHPEDTITRGEFATLLTKALGLKAKSASTKFADAKGSWMEPYVQAVSEAGFMAGYSTTDFGSGDPLTQEEVVVILSRVGSKYGVGATLADRWLPDAPSDWADKQVHIAIQQGLIVDSFGDKAFKPLDQANRAQVASVLDTLWWKLGK